MSLSLLKIEEQELSSYCRLESSDTCYYACEYISHASYQAGYGNNLISNLKKSELDKTRNPRAYKYKEKAIREVAQFLSTCFKPATLSRCIFVPIPPSRIPGDPEYDDRLYVILSLFAKNMYERYSVTINVHKMVVQTQSYDAAHKNDTERPKLDFYESIYRVHEKKCNSLPECIFLFDDVLTTGTHFKAAKNVLQRYYMDKYSHKVNIIGLFIAKTIRDGRTFGFNVYTEDTE